VTKEPERPKPVGGGTLLLVEDETQVRDLTARTLKDLDYTVLAASTGEEALALARQQPGKLSLLITDVVMPNMSGRQVADALSAQQPGMRVLYLSGYTENTVIHHGVLDSNVEFLAKPFTREALAQKVNDILSR